ncbi:MAG: molecular chaperone DnaJ [bacterium]
MIYEKDFYKILSVSKDAKIDEIKRAYRQIAKKYHPDINPDPQAEEIFKDASEAYQVLSDPDKRRIYDMYGVNGLRQQGFSGFTTIDEIFSTFFDDVFSDIFGMRRRERTRTRSERGENIRYDLSLSLEEAYSGKDIEIKIDRMVACDKCKGTGGEGGDIEYATCPSCGGRGHIAMSQGFFTLTTSCQSCSETGYVIKNPCKRCSGEGRIRERSHIKVEIPAGIDDGMKIRLTGEGNAGKRGGTSGNLFIIIHLKPHNTFIREGDNLRKTIEITFPQAVLGDKINIQTLDGNIDVIIPSGIQHGETILVKNKGMKKLNNRGYGDLILDVNIKTPKKLNNEELKLYKRLKEIMDKKR